MNQIAKLLAPTHVVLNLNVPSKEQLFQEIGGLFQRLDAFPSASVVAGLTSREQMGSTGMGHGLALPHGRLKHLKTTLCAFARLAQPVDFDAPDGEPVDLVFVVLVPSHATEQHLQLLGELAQMFSDPRLREQLRTCETEAEAHRLLTEWSAYAPGKRSASL